MPQGKRITQEEWNRMKSLLEKGHRPPQIAFKMGRSKNAIYTAFRDRGVRLSNRATRTSGGISFDLPEEPDYSKLSDDVLFSPKMFPAF